MSDAPQRGRVVVIDGPAGAGKSTVARTLARELGLTLLDTGAIYRTVALAAERAGVSWDDDSGLVALCRELPLRFRAPTGPDRPQEVWLGKEEVTAAIRTPQISAGASVVSAHPGVRAALLVMQRALGRSGCVAEGRDMGTVVFPHASHKFFVTASPRVRARRRHEERVARGEHNVPSVGEVQRDIEQRDLRDTTRASSPLSCADDAVVVDTSQMEPSDVVAHILERIRRG